LEFQGKLDLLLKGDTAASWRTQSEWAILLGSRTACCSNFSLALHLHKKSDHCDD
jgi:hypothetical protein